MMPREFLEKVVRPNISEWEANFGSERHAYNAVAAVDSLTAHLTFGAKPTRQPGLSAFRMIYSTGHPSRDAPGFRVASRHRQGTEACSTHFRKASGCECRAGDDSLGWGEERLGEGRWGGPPKWS